MGVASEFNAVSGAIAMARIPGIESRIRTMLNPHLNHIGAPSMKAKLAAALAAAFIITAGSGWHAAAQDASPAQPIHRTSEQQKAKLITGKRPLYPKHLKEAGIEGSVLLEVTIGRDGKVRKVDSSAETQGHPDFVQPSIDAVTTWEYEPTLLNGEPVEVMTTVRVNFTLMK
jgi:TonB family protein